MSFVLIDRPRPHTALITLNRPERMNAMAFDVMVPFREALAEAGRDNDTRVIVITGAGRGFCSGADLESPGRVPGVEGLTIPTIALRSMELLDDVVRTLRGLHQPVIGAINGPAIGGGLCLSLATDIRIAADTACFRAAGIGNGLTASELGLSYLLPRAVGSSRAFEIMLSGRDVGAAEAERIGLVSRSVPGDRLLDSCYELAERIAGFSRPGVELTKRMLWAGLDAASLNAHMDHEGIAQLFVRLATVGEGGHPHLVVVTFAVHKGTVYTAVDHKPKRSRDLKRLANIRANPHVTLLADHYEDDWDRIWWVRVDGHAQIIEDPEEMAAPIGLLADRYSQYREHRPEGPVIAITITRWTGWSATD